MFDEKYSFDGSNGRQIYTERKLDLRKCLTSRHLLMSHTVIVCPSVRLGLTMVKFSYSLVWHHETAVYAVK